MSEAPDKHSRTEDPTEHRLRTAIEKGNAPVSRDLVTFTALAGMLGAMLVIASSSATSLVHALALFLDSADRVELEMASHVQWLMLSTLLPMAMTIAPALLVIFFAGLSGYLIQGKLRLVPDRIKPELSRISFSKGWERIFGQRGLVEFLKSFLKLGIIIGCAVAYLASINTRVLNALYVDPFGLPSILLEIVSTILILTLVVSAGFVGADVLWARFSWRKELRMTREEVKDEHKQLEGNPQIRARLKALSRERARRRMMSAVPRATLVIANPTHYAVALRYVRSEGGAPVCLAKGKDLVALRIREIAESQGIPVFEDKPLARSLHDAVSVDQMIPPDFYRAVAKIILFLSSQPKSQFVR